MTNLSLTEIALRLGLVVVLCGAIGLERESHGHPAGLRTNILVGMGAAVFTMVSAYGLNSLADRPGDIGLDPSRIAAQVVSGIGFLGAGAIIHQGEDVRGLTTAAAIWIAAAIGMAAAVGFYSLALIGTALVLIALLVVRSIRADLRSRTAKPRPASGTAQNATDTAPRSLTPAVVSTTTRPRSRARGPRPPAGARTSTTPIAGPPRVQAR